MIRARFNRDNNNHITMSVSGHSGAAEVGQDIVCASASILAYTIAQLVKDYSKKGMLVKKPRIILNKGRSTVCCTPKDEYVEEVYHSFYVVQTGMNLLAHNYPQYVCLEMF